MGIEKQDKGQVILNGQDISKYRIDKRANKGIGFAFQQPVKFKGITVFDLLKLSAGKTISKKEACDILSKVGLCAKEYVDREVKYDVTHYKVVPVDYKETAQDRELIENGHYHISYGSDMIEEYDYSSISFMIDNVNYALMTTSNLAEDEMFTLAEEYIDFIKN